MGTPITRRGLVGRLVGAAMVSGRVLGAAGGARAAAPAVADPVIRLTFMPWYNTVFNAAGTALMNAATEVFDAAHPGLRLQGLPGPQVNNSPVATDGAILGMLNGSGPDVVADCCNAFTQYIAAGVAMPLDGYLRQSGISTSIWSRGHVAALTRAGSLYGLPVYDGPQVFAYRRDILDQLGLAVPAPDWTHDEAAALWRQCTGTVRGTHRYGAVVEWYSTWFQEPVYLLKGFGGGYMDATGTRCLLGTAGSIAAGEWIYPLLWDRVVAPRDFSATDWGAPQDVGLINGTAVFQIAGGWDILPFTEAFGNAFPWDFLPVPRWPRGQATFTNNDFWIMNALSPHPDAAWEVMRWVAAEPFYQRDMMKVQLEPPSLVALWEEFEARLTAAAPVLRNKSLHYFRDAAVAGYGYPEEFFTYQPSQADGLINAQIARLWNRQTDVASAFTQAARQVDALEVVGRAEERVVGREVSAFEAAVAAAERAGGKTVAFPAPPGSGLGVPARPAPGAVRRGPGSAAFTLRGAGGAGLSGTSDNGTLAAQAYRPSRGRFVCRLVALVPPAGRSLAAGASAGLLARGDLTDDAACIALVAVVGSGINLDTRVGPGQPLAQNTPAVNAPGAVFWPGESHPESPGLIAPSSLFAARPAAGGNILARPVWLRLDLDVDRWLPWTSWDGVHWMTANPPGNPPATVQMAGSWVGLFVTSAAPGETVRAVFDHVSGFAPDVFVQLGRP